MPSQNFRVKNGLEVGTGVTISAGIITATTVSIGGSITAGTIYGDGSGLTNAGSSLSAASGSQRVVLTSLTSGTMTSAATNSNLLYNSTTNSLSCTNFNITNINATGIVTAVTFSGQVNAGVSTLGVGTATNLTTQQLNISGLSTFAGVTTHTASLFGTQGSFSGIVTAVTFSGQVNAGVGTITTLTSTSAGLTNINSTGISTLGVTSTTNLTAQQINVSGVGTITTLIGTTLRNYGETVNTVGNTGTAATINLANGNFVTATLTGNCTFTFTTGLSSGAVSFTLLLTNDATPGRSIIWPPAVKWPNATVPTRTTAANKTDVYTFFTYDNGTTWWGNLSLYNYS